MKVAIYVPHGAVPDKRGFAPAIVAWNFALQLRHLDPFMISVQEDYCEATDTIEGIPIRRLHESALYNRIFKKITRLDPWPLDKRAAHFVNDIAPDICHVHQLEFDVERFSHWMKKRVPILVHAHVTNRTFNPVRGIANRYIAVSDYVKTQLIEKGYPSEKVAVVRNGVDTTQFSPASIDEKTRLRLALNIPSDCRVLTFVGRKQEVKGFHTFLQTVVRLLESRQDIFVIAAGGEPLDSVAEASYASRQILRQRLSDTHRYLDLTSLPHNQLSNIYKISDITLLPSLTEPQGMVVLESMASGCVTISSRVGGIPESITHGVNGYLLNKPEDEEEAQRLVEDALDNINNLDSIRAAARGEILRKFDWPVVAAQLEKIYLSALERPN
ncbi:MAG: hypothetical protein C3F18_05730 [Nitrosomonadales bacterium]|nr:MAG: hypothetical protein C3F18_05730 [Nitrosomonadales bacterium]